MIEFIRLFYFNPFEVGGLFLVKLIFCVLNLLYDKFMHD